MIFGMMAGPPNPASSGRKGVCTAPGEQRIERFLPEEDGGGCL